MGGPPVRGNTTSFSPQTRQHRDGPQSLSLITALLAHVNLSSATVVKLFLQSSAEEYDAFVRLLPTDFPNLRLLYVIEAAGAKMPAGEFEGISAHQSLRVSVCVGVLG